ncbi:MAG TPA: aminomethyl-transferring glycine dehydrogenase subunit GcvPA [Candidatus Krumholzibacteriaceae bacterium]|nr:aminomethyl-transferring glycine dehydrogenase subunit GcvPA [Candidatus Krumholzibacteriaceae bacterium]
MAGRNHPYIPNSTPEVKKELMQELGIQTIDELYKDIPEKFLLKHALNLPKGLSEFEVKRHVESLLAKNKTFPEMPIFLGAGCWPHYVPAAVLNVILRSEFLTSYTPYQPEISQGMLQALFEYQSMICELTGMEAANSSMYDWASAVGEAARMAARVTKRSEIIAPKIIHPERDATLQTYTEPAAIKIKHAGYVKKTGQLDIEELKTIVSEKTAAVYLENPSYLGFVETEAKVAAEIAHDKSALFIVGVDPVSLGVLKAPADYGADIVIGEGQPLGNAMSFGGPLLGILACRDSMDLIRQMPGRTIGITTTLDGISKGFCMALQTREQHIRREKATSNICTNEALCAVASAVYLALLGPQGLKELGEACMTKAHYAMRQLAKIEGVKAPIFDAPHFNEFTINFDEAKRSVKEVHESMLLYGVHGGKNIAKEFPELGETALYCVTEIHSKHDIDRLTCALSEVLKKR